MKLQLEKNDWKWFKLRRRLFEDKRCERQEKSKAAIFAALAGRWRDRGISGSSRDWCTRYPNELFDSDFYAALVKARREGREECFDVDGAFRTILRLRPPEGFAQRFWLMHGGGHKLYLLRALLGPEEFASRAKPNQWVLLFKTDWNPTDYLGFPLDEEKLLGVVGSGNRLSRTLDVIAQLTPVMVSFAGMTGHVRDDPQEAETGSPCDSRILDEPKSADEREGQS